MAMWPFEKGFDHLLFVTLLLLFVSLCVLLLVLVVSVDCSEIEDLVCLWKSVEGKLFIIVIVLDTLSHASASNIVIY